MKRVYLLTGRPGSGKTSLVVAVVSKLGHRAGGFYTEEIREGGVRRGFRLVTLDGEQVTLAHVNTHGPQRVGRYGVDVEALDRVAVPALERTLQTPNLVVIDEIGKMELLSPRFREVVTYAIASGKKVLGTIMLESSPFADAIKGQSGVNVITFTKENRQRVLAELLEWTGANPQ